MTFEQLRKFAPQVLQIARKHGIAKVYVFGSVARGNSGYGAGQAEVYRLLKLQI